MIRGLLSANALLGAALLAGCGDSSKSTASAQAPAVGQPATGLPAATQSAATAAQASVSAPAPVTLKTSRSRYGRILVDARGRTLYLFTHDRPGVSRCRGECAGAWPPYLVRRKGRAAAGARSSLLGTVRRPGGQRQLSYNGHPLYYYVGDRRPGQILCQDVEEYGGHWWIVSPAGKPVTGRAPPC